jgi:NAD-dependent dihydropyrimidine dehydrogenase PreA subunit
MCGSCIDVCPTECISEGEDQYYINPEECIDCGTCIDECASEAIFAEEDLPADQKEFIIKNAEFFS